MTPTALLFPGQGAQYVGMGAALYERDPRVRQLFDEASAVLGYDLYQLCRDGPAERLNATDFSQPAIYVASLAAYEAWQTAGMSEDIQVVAVAGLSLGEYTALTVAGAIRFADGLRLVQRRGQAMQAAAMATPSAMTSVLGLETPQVEELVAEARGPDRLYLANYLCPGNIVVSGDLAAIERLESLAVARGGIRTVRLAVAGAFHTPLMQPADRELAQALQQVAIHPPQIPVWSNVDAQPHTDPADFPDLLVQQIVRPVRWEETMRNLLAAGVERFYEIGPGRVLAGLLKRIHRRAEVVNIPA